MDVNVREKVKSLLEELFQFDSQDLDFGIYRIMNFKRREIEKFIEKDLIAQAEKQFKEYSQVGQEALQSDIEKLENEIIRDFGDETLDSQGNVKKNEDAPKIKQYISKMKSLEEIKLTQSQIDDVFNHIYEFFSRYYDKGDFISKRRYGGKEKYYIPYNGQELAFSWANFDQYYVKNSEFFKKYCFSLSGYQISFILLEVAGESNANIDWNKYFVLSSDKIVNLDENKKEISVYLNWRALSDPEKIKYGQKNTQKAIVIDGISLLSKALEGHAIAKELFKRVDEERVLLEKHLSRYVERNKTDYFVHKNLKSFLERELDFYIKNEIMDLDEIETFENKQEKLGNAKIKAIREISRKIIDFLSQIEEFQKSMFEKKKFVISSNYCLTLDKIDSKFYYEIGRNEEQVKEWKSAFRIDETTQGTLDGSNPAKDQKTLEVEFLKGHRNLVLDTKFFSTEFKNKLLSSFVNLDKQIDGIVIKSDNYHALKLLNAKYREKINCIYIDPPFNTGSDDFIYKDNYRHSTWVTMLFDRLKLARDFLFDDGVILASIDDNEVENLILLMKIVFGENNHVANICQKSRDSISNDLILSSNHNFQILFAKDWSVLFANRYDFRLPGEVSGFSNPDGDTKGPWKPVPVDGPGGASKGNPYYTFKGITGYFRYSKDTMQELYDKGEIIVRDGSLSRKYYQSVAERKGQVATTWWDDVGTTTEGTKMLLNLFGTKPFNSPKPINLIKKICSLATNSDDEVVLDFFAGSGTTAHAVMKLNSEDKGNRKYILVESGEYFETVLLPRLKKIMYSEEWKNGKPISSKGFSQFFKYVILEQYEDSLNNVVFSEANKQVQETLDGFQDYFVHYMLDYETRRSSTRLLLERFEKPFDYKIKLMTGCQERDTTIDLVETFNYLLGVTIEKVQTFNDADRTYQVVFGKTRDETVAIIWRDIENLDLNRDREFIEGQILSGKIVYSILVNGDSYVKNAKAIEPEFKRLMGA